MTLPTCPAGPVVLAAALAGLAAPACDEATPVVPAPSYELFVREVYPVVLRDCAFQACHGDPRRSYHVFGPGRLRLDPETDLLDPATGDELVASYERTRAMLLRPAGEPEAEALLLRKPIGGGHQGTDVLGRNVYADADDPAWARVIAWATAAGEEEP